MKIYNFVFNIFQRYKVEELSVAYSTYLYYEWLRNKNFVSAIRFSATNPAVRQDNSLRCLYRVCQKIWRIL